MKVVHAEHDEIVIQLSLANPALSISPWALSATGHKLLSKTADSTIFGHHINSPLGSWRAKDCDRRLFPLRILSPYSAEDQIYK